MTKETILIRSILGPTRRDIFPMACAVEIVKKLLFCRKIPLDDIRMTKDIYPAVARQTKKSCQAVARQIERTGNLCWESMDEGQKMQYIGKAIKDIQGPRDMIFYLAFYSYFHKPYYEILENPPWSFYVNKVYCMSELKI